MYSVYFFVSLRHVGSGKSARGVGLTDGARHSIQIILHSLRTFALIISSILKSTINSFFLFPEQSNIARACGCGCMLVRALQPLGLLRNLFEVNHNEAFYPA